MTTAETTAPAKTMIGTPLGRRLEAAGIPEKRARQLGNMVEGLKTLMHQDAFVGQLEIDDILPILALLLGDSLEALATNPRWQQRISKDDIMQLVEIAQTPDPSPQGVASLYESLLSRLDAEIGKAAVDPSIN